MCDGTSAVGDADTAFQGASVGRTGAQLIGVSCRRTSWLPFDDWLSGQSEPLSRPETIRRLIKIALKKGGKSR